MLDEDLVEITDKKMFSCDDMVVFRMENKHFQAAKKYLSGSNMSKYSVQKGEEFEITLSKKNHSSIISQIEDFTSEEIKISNYERSLSVLNGFSETFLNVHFKISHSTLLLYGLKKEVGLAKLDFLAKLEDPYGIDISCKSSEVEKSTIKQTNITENPKKSDDAEANAFSVYTSVGNASEESSNLGSDTIGRSGSEMLKRRKRGMKHNLKDLGAIVYTGSKTDFKVFVRQADITNLDVDIIVNAANRNLRHNGGVSRAIASAAGQSLVKECDSFITTHGPLVVTDVFVSSGGLLAAKYVMHTVGPKWIDYSDKELCLTALRRTVVRCLVEASRLKKVSIALPSISAELCAQCYVEALKSFDEFAENVGVSSVRDIWFVDVDDDMVNMIQEEFMKGWHKSADQKVVAGDFEFAKQHISDQNYAKSGSSRESHAAQDKCPQPSSQATQPREESHIVISQEAEISKICYQVNSMKIYIVTEPATVYKAPIVVFGQLFNELYGIKTFNAIDTAKPRVDLPKQKESFQYFSMSNPNGNESVLICQLHPNPDSPEYVTKAFGNLENAKEIHSSNTVIFTSAVLYVNAKDGQVNSKIISRLADVLLDFAAMTSSTNSEIKSILFATGEDCIPQIVKIFDSRKAQKLPSVQTSKGCNPSTSGGYSYPSTSNSSGYPTSTGGYPTSIGGYPAAAGRYSAHTGEYPAKSIDFPSYSDVYSATSCSNSVAYKVRSSPDLSSDYKAIAGAKQGTICNLDSSVDSQDYCHVCLERRNIEVLQCCQALMCSTCLGKVSICPFCRFHWTILKGSQPNGEMHCRYSTIDVEGYERKGCLVIEYHIPAGIQTEELHHPSPGKPYKSVRRIAYLPATEDGYNAMRLLRVAFHRRLVFTIGLSHIMQIEGIVWNIHHKTTPNSSEHGYPDPTYLLSLIHELKQSGVTEDSLTEEEKSLVADCMESVKQPKGRRV